MHELKLIFHKFHGSYDKLYEYREKNAAEVGVLRSRITRLMQTMARGSIAESLIADNRSDSYLTMQCKTMVDAGAALIENGFYIFSDESGVSV